VMPYNSEPWPLAPMVAPFANQPGLKVEAQ